MSITVRCPSCQQRSRVAESALGLLVACPRCPTEFVARADEAPILQPDIPRQSIPTFHSQRRSEAAPKPTTQAEEVPHHTGPNGFLISVALLPLGIPLVWLLVGAITGRETILSFAAPLALAVGVCGLCGGIALTHWSTPARIRAMLAVVVLAYLVSGVLYFVKQSWLEEVRKNFNFNRGEREFVPPDKAYIVRFPGLPKEQETSPIEGWALKAFRFADPNRAGSGVFVSAHGLAPKDFLKEDPEEIWFQKAKAKLLQTTGAALVKDDPIRSPDFQAHEYELQFPDDQLKRVVRIVRIRNRVFYLSVDGPFLTGDTPDVQEFMKSFKLPKMKG